MSLTVTFWGTRGSVPTPGPTTVRYGGNTPCVDVRTAANWQVILDAGTGIRELGHALVRRAEGRAIAADIFLTHAHWDHIQGIPFFAPIFERGNRFTIWGSASLETSIDRVLRDQMSPVVFPVAFESLAATIDFRHLADGERRTGTGYEVAAMEVRHPGGALAYRFQEPGATRPALVYVPDNELGEHARYGPSSGWRDRFVEFVRGARLLVHDSTYTTEEYPEHRGWGHSTYAEASALAVEAGVETLALFHHEPQRSDTELERCADACRTIVAGLGGSTRVLAAAEGLSLVV